MKPIIIDMKDMSDSAEVYEAKPNLILTGFIYLIFAIIVVALVWMYFCKIDIVVKGTGTVAAAEEVATVTNQVTGVITERKIEDGQEVKAGEVLYTISHEDQTLQLATLKQQLADSEEKEKMLTAYKGWLENGEEFPVETADNLYYAEVAARKHLVELGQESVLQAYTGEMSAYNVKMNANTEMITYYSDAVMKSKQLIEAIRSRKNSFSSEETYYWNMVENYLVKYQQIENQYDGKIGELQRQRNAAAKEIDALKASKLALQERESVSGGDVDMAAALQQEKKALDEQLASQRSLKEAADSSIRQMQSQKSIELNAYERETATAIENNILGYEQNLATYEGTGREYANGQNLLIEQGTENELGNLVAQEMHSVAGELESCRQSQIQLLGQIETLEQGIANATVRASLDGRVNLATDLVEGDYIAAGTQVLSIIPDTETGGFVVRSYIENKDIAKIHEGMEVTYEIGAYPSSEYGIRRGKVTFVSEDLKVNNSGSAYYVVETSVDAEVLHNRVGEAANLKVGMLCETRIVIEEKRVLQVLMEKLFHI